MKNEVVKAVLKGISALFVLGAGAILGKESVKNSREALDKTEKK
jgi:hypothetical protein